jgi:hypothetical protein
MFYATYGHGRDSVVKLKAMSLEDAKAEVAGLTDKGFWSTVLGKKIVILHVIGEYAFDLNQWQKNQVPPTPPRKPTRQEYYDYLYRELGGEG